MKIGKLRIRPTRRGWTILALIALMLSSYTADAVASTGRIRSGVQAGSLELGGKTSDEARAALTERAELLTSRPVELFADDYKATIAPSQISFRPDVTGTLEDANSVGRRGNFFVRMWHRTRALFASTDVGWRSSYDNDATSTLVGQIGARIDTEGHEAGIRARGRRVVAVGPVPGRRLDHDRAAAAIVNGLETWPRRSAELPISVRNRRTTMDDARAAAERANEWARSAITLVAPDDSRHTLDRAGIVRLLEAVPRKRGLDWDLELRFSPDLVKSALAPTMAPFEREAKDAGFAVSGTSASVVAGQQGREFDAAATARRLAEAADRDDRRVARAAFTDVEPELTTQEARDLRITELVSSFTTHHPCCQPRVENIHKIAETVNGAIVKPGATFSLNGYVGPRTAEKGYVLAPMIFDGEFKDDVGGGVSQFATTMFNAIFFGGYRFSTYKAHSYYISRYPPGREATISWPRPDLAFVNTSGAGVLIRTSYSSTSITVSLYGDKEGKTVNAETGERTNFTDFPTQRKANPDMAPGAEVVSQSGAQGFDITVTRVIRQGDDETRTRFFTRYKPQPKIIEYGPGAPATPSPQATGSPAPSPSGREPRRPAPSSTPGRQPTTPQPAD